MNSFLVELHVALLKFENFSDNFSTGTPALLLLRRLRCSDVFLEIGSSWTQTDDLSF